MTRRKRRFSYEERYAIWLCNEMRCWWCREPLRLVDVTVDHVLPESLLDDDDKRQKILYDYGLSINFNINSYENWLPCHNRCNQSKSNKTPDFIPGNKVIFDSLRQKAPEMERVARAVSSNLSKDKVFNAMFVALERQTISMRDIDDLLRAFVDDPVKAGVPEDVIILDSGYWVRRDQIVSQGMCRCERQVCVGHSGKVYCYFTSSLSPWVTNTRLFWRCYDEIITCPRCSGQHKRGHIGLEGICGRPYLDQAMQRD
jgi:hypothetical protein